jgi:hypothetical protein
MTKNSNDLSRGEKILLFLLDFGKGEKTHIRFEDIVVGLFKKYPSDFHLKGYKEYPDSGDLVHKPLYDFKKKGYLTAANKVFSLTDRGIEYAKQILHGDSGSHTVSSDRLSRSTSAEVNRIKHLEGFVLFKEGKKDQLSESDFYNYLSVTVRTPKNAFVGRLETMKAVISELKEITTDQLYCDIVKYNDCMFGKYSKLSEFFINQ